MTEAAGVCRRRSSCRLCGSRALSMVLQLAPTPPANAFVPPSALGVVQARFPLDLHLCGACGHLQLLDVLDPSVLFSDYVYVSGTSPVFVRHFSEYARELCRRFAPLPGSLVLDIGSNDGTLLGFFRDLGYRVLGVDPAGQLAAQATARGIETRCGFFGSEFALSLRSSVGQAAVITANNVFAHVDGLEGFTRGVRTMLAPDGVFVFEVSYLRDIYEKNLFDTIYHEHLDYHAVAPLIDFFRRCDLELFDVVRVDTHGGSLRGFVQHRGGRRPVSASVAELVAAEQRLGLDRPETFACLGRAIADAGQELGSLLHRLKAQGQRLAAYGAPAKATTLMHHFGLGPELLEFVVDDSPLKQGLYTPGLHLPVVPAETLYARRPDQVVILAWNFSEAIVQKHQRYLHEGGHFIVPLPRLRTV